MSTVTKLHKRGGAAEAPSSVATPRMPLIAEDGRQIEAVKATVLPRDMMRKKWAMPEVDLITRRRTRKRTQRNIRRRKAEER